MTEKELWYVPITCQWATAGNLNFIDFKSHAPGAIHKPMRVNPKLLTAMKHAHGKRITARRSEVKYKVYMLLYCHTPVTFVPKELEEDTAEVSPDGDILPTTYPLYAYLLKMINSYIKEVANECNLRQN